VVPRHYQDGLKGFFWPRKTYAQGEMEAVAGQLRDAIARLTAV
jgi:histidine triad (HIT) family protein